MTTVEDSPTENFEGVENEGEIDDFEGGVLGILDENLIELEEDMSTTDEESDEGVNDVIQIRDKNRKTAHIVFCCKFFKFLIIITLVTCFFVTELSIGWATNTLTLVSDSLHILSDSLSYSIGLVALVLSCCRKTTSYSYGWGRAEVLGGLGNGVFFLSVVLFIYINSIGRFISVQPMEKPILVLVVGILGLCMNCCGMFVFGHHHHGHDHHHDEDKKLKKKYKNMTDEEREEFDKNDTAKKIERIQSLYDLGHSDLENDHFINDEEKTTKLSELKEWRRKNIEEVEKKQKKRKNKIKKRKKPWNLNMMGVFFHVMGDFMGSIFVLILCTINLIFPPKYNMDKLIGGGEVRGSCRKNCFVPYCDPITSLCLGTIILFASIPVLISSSKILMQRAPKVIDLEKLKMVLETIGGVISIHDLHVWTLVDDRYICSMHIHVSKDHMFSHGHNEIHNKVQCILHEEYNIHASTIQLEYSRLSKRRKKKCRNRCISKKCIAKSCCPDEFFQEWEFVKKRKEFRNQIINDDNNSPIEDEEQQHQIDEEHRGEEIDKEETKKLLMDHHDQMNNNYNSTTTQQATVSYFDQQQKEEKSEEEEDSEDDYEEEEEEADHSILEVIGSDLSSSIN